MGWLQPVGLDEEDRLDRKAATKVVRRALRYLRPYRGEVWLGFAIMALATACIVAPPYLFGLAIDRLRQPKAGGYVDRVAIVVAIVSVAAWVLSRAQIIVVTRVGEKFLRDLRKRAFDHLLAMS